MDQEGFKRKLTATFDNPEKEEGEHLHHFSDEKDVGSLLSGWEIERMEDAE